MLLHRLYGLRLHFIPPLKKGDEGGFFQFQRGMLLLVLSAAILSLAVFAFADNGTEFGVEDDLTVWGTSGTWPDSDVEIKGYSIFGSTASYEPSAVISGTGSVVIGGNLEVGGNSYFMNNVAISTGAKVGIGMTSPTAVLHLKAGTASANAAPLKFTSGTNLTIPEAGAMEFDGTDFYLSPASTRKTIAFTDSNITGTAAGLSSTLAVYGGGTGKSSWTQYLIPYADSTISFSQIPIGIAGQVLTSNGSGGAPSFQTMNSMVYPSAGIAVSAGSAWGTSLTFDIDGSLIANADTNIPSQKAVKTYADTKAAKGANSDITSLGGLTTPLSTGQGGTGSTADANAANGIVKLDGSRKLPAVDGSQLTGVTGYSNVIFQWVGVDTTGNYYGLVTGTSDHDSSSTPGVYEFFKGGHSPGSQILAGKFTKIAGIKTVTIFARLRSDSPSHPAKLDVDIGGYANTVSRTAISYAWATPATIDVSALNNGTTYDITIKLGSDQDGVYYGFCSAVTLIGS